MSEARTGWGGEFWLSTNLTTASLVEMVEVVSFSLPDDTVEEVDVSHLKSPDKRREFKPGMIDGGTVEVEVNYSPGSATDVAIRNARDTRTVRAVRFVIPDEEGVAEWEVDTFAFVSGYSRGPVVGDGKISSTVRLRITGAQTEAAA